MSKKTIWLLAVLLSGCAATGVQVSQEAAMQFKEGVSTERDIIQKLGQPTSTTISGNFKFIIYSGGQAQVKGASFIPVVGMFAGGSDYAGKSVIYQIRKDGILEKTTYSEYNGGTRRGTTPAPMNAQEPRAIQ